MHQPPADRAAAAPGTAPRRGGMAQTFSALGFRDFRLLWTATIFQAGGVWLQQVTLGWLAYDLTRSPLQVGTILGVRSAPMLLAPLAGVLVDRVDRRRLLLVDQALVTALVLGFALDVLMGWVVVWHLYVFAVLFGVLWTINNPVRQVLVANSVPRERLMNATALNSIAFNSMRAVGPAAGGFFIALFGPGWNFLLQGLLFCVAFALLVPYRARYTAERRARTASPLRDLLEGARHLRHDPTTLAATLVTFVLMLTLTSMAFNQLPVYNAEVLVRGPESLGLLLMALGVGGVVGAVALARFAAYPRKGLLSTIGFTGAAIAVMALAEVEWLWLAMVVLAFEHLCTQIVLSTNLTIVQMVTPDHLRGRVTGVYQMEIGMMVFGGIAAGAIASAYGVGTALWVAGIAGLAGMALIVVFVPHFRRLVL